MKIRIALIGVGNISKYFIEAISKSDNFEIVLLCDNKEVENNNLIWVNDYTSLEDYKNEFDAAIICLPNFLHYECSRYILGMKKHVLCEKPLCFNNEEAIDLQNIADENDVLLMTAYHRRYNKFYKDFDINSSVNNIDAYYLENIKEHSESSLWYEDVSKIGGGCIIDNGTNVVDCIINLVGDIKINDVVSSKVVNDIEYDAKINFEFSDGYGVINLSWDYDGEFKKIILKNTDSDFEIDFIKKNENDLRTSNFKGSLYHEYELCIDDFYNHIISGKKFDNLIVIQKITEIYEILRNKSK